MGKYGIGVRVRDCKGDEGVIIAKRKGQRMVNFDNDCFNGMWLGKSHLTVIDDNPSKDWIPNVGDKVRIARNSRGHGYLEDDVGKELTVTGNSYGEVFGDESHFWWPTCDLDPATEVPDVFAISIVDDSGQPTSLNSIFSADDSK